jgi:hypothetical protein
MVFEISPMLFPAWTDWNTFVDALGFYAILFVTQFTPFIS